MACVDHFKNFNVNVDANAEADTGGTKCISSSGLRPGELKSKDYPYPSDHTGSGG